MGSHNFENATYSHTDARSAYDALVRDALYESGHDGYNGTISTTGGFRIASRTPMTLAQARAYADKHLDEYEKWDECGAVPLVAETEAEWDTPDTYTAGPWRKTFTFDVRGATAPDHAQIKAAVAKHAKVKADQIVLVRHNSHSVVKDVTVKAAAAKAKTVTRYFITDPKMAQMPPWEKGHPTQAAARAAAVAALSVTGQTSGWERTSDVQWDVIAITRRETGEPLVTINRAVKGWTVTVEYVVRTLIKPATAGKTVAGWYFFGWAAS